MILKLYEFKDLETKIKEGYEKLDERTKEKHSFEDYKKDVMERIKNKGSEVEKIVAKHLVGYIGEVVGTLAIDDSITEEELDILKKESIKEGMYLEIVR